MPLLRRLNEQGIERLKQYLGEVVANPDAPAPYEILTGPDTSEALTIDVNIEPKTFGSRMEAAEYLNSVLSGEGGSPDRDRGVWAWLALFYFQQLCPKKNGKRKPGQLARWIPSGHAFRYYRHLLAGPYLIYRAFRDKPDRAAIVLCGPLDSPGDIVEQLVSRQDFVQNRAVIETATKLYLDSKTGRPKRGAADTKHRPGTLRRFVDVINQFDPTWDLYSMDSDKLLSKLPGEFDSFKA